MKMATQAVRLFRKMDGLFAVYKPQGVHWKLVRDTIESNFLKALNSSPPAAPRREVQFQLLSSGENSTSKELILSPSMVPSLADHPLVTGPQFHKVHVGVGHRLDAFSSGVLVLGVGKGNSVLENLCKSHVTRDYTIEGEFGKATDNFSHTGRVIEKTTYDHITHDKLERVLAMLQGSNQKALITYSQVELQTQEAYELAARGLLYPDGKSPPILTGLRCIKFNPPHFTLEVRCVNETQKYLRKLIHEVGLELRASAVCTKVRRTRDGPFKVENALTRQHWTADSVLQAINHFRKTARKIRKSGMYMQSNVRMTLDADTREQTQSEHMSGVRDVLSDMILERETPGEPNEGRTKN
ncbi:pseudouridylate synthase TRUB2, mitochondrial [Danio rerio]|uniref:Pseudouridylate synthase TRUB2, mitochondrial n=1 Tax=Danio rerio TaxID=7955 RepID=A0A8M1N020_DANRE|nr:mitochondrial mRNA pseudouridine synthase TRUB2 [Danio rerio]|eukprot:NP_001002200.2 probable tRNA pseudouridine synthase 2 [Danio rerio]